MVMKASAKLKINSEKSNGLKWRKSVTTPSGNLSIKFPKAPAMISKKDFFFKLSFSSKKIFKKYIVIRKTIINRIYLETKLFKSRKLNAIPELKTIKKSIKGRKSFC